jgi:glycosyl hydrolase family 53
MRDLTTAVVANGGLGTVYWEPAWLSTDCRTKWGQGSHWENATLFDFEGVLGDGAGYLSATYSRPGTPAATASVADDVAGDASQPAADLTRLSAVMDADTINVSVTFAGDAREMLGVVTLAFDIAPGGGTGGRRPFDYEDATRPESVLETSFRDEPGVGYASPVLSVWTDGEWSERTFTGSVSVDGAGEGATTVSWVIPRELVGDAEPVGLAVLTAQRGRAGGLDDAFGIGGETAGVPVILSMGGEQ